jgi:uncharacterized RDD family membrane protein YckC
VSEVRRRVHEIVTPEGVPLRFGLATAGERFGAFFLDLVLIVVAIWLLTIVVVFAEAYGDWLGVFLLLAFFALRNFYFVWFEIRRGRTLGKRMLGIRVIDREGGPLRGEAIFARNLTREIEFWVPTAVILFPGIVSGGAAAAVLAIAWALVMLFFPLFNRDRRRLGDLLAGTIVVSAPRAVLLADLGSVPSHRGRKRHTFSEQALDAYGIHELHVLEDILRRPRSRVRARVLDEVVTRIKRRTGIRDEVDDAERFLREYYAALRARLEQRLLLGQRKADKHAR